MHNLENEHSNEEESSEDRDWVRDDEEHGDVYYNDSCGSYENEDGDPIPEDPPEFTGNHDSSEDRQQYYDDNF